MADSGSILKSQN